MKQEDAELKKEKENVVGRIIMVVVLLQNLAKYAQWLLRNAAKEKNMMKILIRIYTHMNKYKFNLRRKKENSELKIK